ncbi:hypothetical protein [Streptomyces hokutonensis]|uniref:hypothetical protein n=1 Tax=Streptomyces hokutonensis TaxID=1306990 RepID=UPI0036999BCD
MWSYDVRNRFQRFEAAPDWSVLCAELPLAVFGGILASLGVRPGGTLVGAGRGVRPLPTRHGRAAARHRSRAAT